MDRDKRTLDDPNENRAAQGGESTPGLATRPASRAQAPHWTSTSRQLFICQLGHGGQPRRNPRLRTRHGRLSTRDIPLDSAAQLQTLPRLPHFTFPDEPFRVRRAFHVRSRGRRRTAAPYLRRSPPPSTAQSTPRLDRGRTDENQRARAAPHLQLAAVHRFCFHKIRATSLPHQQTSSTSNFPQNPKRNQAQSSAIQDGSWPLNIRRSISKESWVFVVAVIVLLARSFSSIPIICG